MLQGDLADARIRRHLRILADREHRLVRADVTNIPPGRTPPVRKLSPEAQSNRRRADDRRAGSPRSREVRPCSDRLGIGIDRHHVGANMAERAKHAVALEAPDRAAQAGLFQAGCPNSRGHHDVLDRVDGQHPNCRWKVLPIQNPDISRPAAQSHGRATRESGGLFHDQTTLTSAAPAPSGMVSPNAIASSINVSTMSPSRTVLITSPRTKIWPLPLPEATPRSASRASPGPFTTHPITATRSGTSRPCNPAVTSSASL